MDKKLRSEIDALLNKHMEQAHGTSLVNACITVSLLNNVRFIVALHAKL